MPLLSRKRLIAAKIESTYGVDPVPTGADCMLIRNLTVTGQDADFAGRDLLRPYLGRSEQLPAAIRAKVEFEIELAGSSAAGTAPPYGAILRSCGLSQTLMAAPVTGTAVTGSTVSTIKLAAAASAVTGFYVGMPVTITAGTGSGQTRYIVAYDGSNKTAVVELAWVTTPDATSQYSIGANAQYRPVSGAFESVAVYANVDGVLHKMLGMRGTASFALSIKEIPVIKYSGTALYSAITDTVALTPDFTAYQQPLPVNAVNTPSFSLHGYAAAMSEISIDLSNEVAHRTLVGQAESVLLTDRQAQGSVTIEAPTIAQKDYWTLAKTATLGFLGVTHGLVAGNRVRIDCPRTQVTAPQYTDLDGIQMLQMGLNMVPSSTGNDEFILTVF